MDSFDCGHDDGIPPRRGVQAPQGYQLLDRLGRGGFGEVWKAEGPGGIDVALKYVPMNDGFAAIEGRSLEFLKRIRHPNLLTPFASWWLDGHLAIGMDLADGTLHDRLVEVRALGLTGIPRDELHRYMAQAAEGIDHLNGHRHDLGDGTLMGVQHCDVKPPNMLLFGGGVKMGDLGLARLLERSATGHTGALTVAYAAPEFFTKRTSDRSDQYSLAVAYCELRGGRLPFAGTPGRVMHGHAYDPPDLDMLPPEERAIVGRALAKDPAGRWPDCRAFVAELQAGRPGRAADLIPTCAPPTRTGELPIHSRGADARPDPDRAPIGGSIVHQESQMAHRKRIRPGGRKARYALAVSAAFVLFVVIPALLNHPLLAGDVDAARGGEADPGRRNNNVHQISCGGIVSGNVNK